MGSIVENLKSTLVESIFIYPNDNNEITIKENDPNAKLKKVIIKDIPNDNTFSFSLDKDINCFKNKNIKNNFGVCKKLIPYIIKNGTNDVCDAVIYYHEDKNKIEDKSIHYFFLCELKSESPENRKINQQINSTICFIHYILKLIEIFDNKPLQNDKIIFKKVLFSLRQNKAYTYNTNQQLHEISCSKRSSENNFYFKKLFKSTLHNA